MTQYENILDELRNLSIRLSTLEGMKASDLAEVKRKVDRMSKTLYGDGKNEDAGLVNMVNKVKDSTETVKQKTDEIYKGIKWVVGIVLSAVIVQILYLVFSHSGGP